MSDFTHHRARLAALARHGADPGVLGEAQRAVIAAGRPLAAERMRRLVAAECAREGFPAPSSDLEAVSFVAAVLAAGEAA